MFLGRDVVTMGLFPSPRRPERAVRNSAKPNRCARRATRPGQFQMIENLYDPSAKPGGLLFVVTGVIPIRDRDPSINGTPTKEVQDFVESR